MHPREAGGRACRAMDGECYVLQGLNPLHRHIADFRLPARELGESSACGESGTAP